MYTKMYTKMYTNLPSNLARPPIWPIALISTVQPFKEKNMDPCTSNEYSRMHGPESTGNKGNQINPPTIQHEPLITPICTTILPSPLLTDLL